MKRPLYPMAAFFTLFQNRLTRWSARLSSESLLPLLLSFSVVTWGLAVPLYSSLNANKLFLGVYKPGLLLVVLAFHLLPVLGLFAVDRLLSFFTRAPRLRRVYWTAVFVVFLILLAREAHLYFLKDQTYQLAASIRIALVVATVGTVVAVSHYWHRGVSLWFTYMSAAALPLTIVLLLQAGLFEGTASASDGDALSTGTATPGNSVFILIFDELNYDVLQNNGRVDEQKFPNFAALADDGAWFTNAFSNYAATLYSVPSLLTGELVSGGKTQSFRLPVKGFESKNLLTLLSQYYDINVYQRYFNHCFAKAATVCRTIRSDSALSYLGGTAGFLLERWVPTSLYESLGIGRLRARLQPVTASVDEHFNQFLVDIQASTAPGRVYYYHHELPHSPFIYDEAGDKHDSSHTKFAPGEDFSLVYENYRRQVAYTDSVLGRVISKLKSEGLYEDAVIIVTSDHGIRPDPAVMQTRFPDELSDLIPHIPLVIKAPGIPPQVNTVEYQHTDFVPTVLDVLGITGYDDFSGVSAFSPERPVRDKVFYTKDVFRVDEAYTYDKDTGVWRLIDQ